MMRKSGSGQYGAASGRNAQERKKGGRYVDKQGIQTETAAEIKQRMIQKYVEMVRLRQYCLTKFGKAPEIPTPEKLGLDPEDVDFTILS